MSSLYRSQGVDPEYECVDNSGADPEQNMNFSTGSIVSESFRQRHGSGSSSRHRHGSGDSGKDKVRDPDSERKMFHKGFVLSIKLGNCIHS